MQVLFFMAVWKRPEITELCFMGLRRLTSRCAAIPIKVLAVISEESMIPLCNLYNVEYTTYPNLPLGAKKNHGLNEALKRDWDYLIEIGSDDIVKNELLDLYAEKLTGKYHGLDHFAWLNSETGECRADCSSGVFGAGRAIRRDAFEVCKGIALKAKTDIISPGRSLATGETGFFKTKQALQLQQAGYAELLGDETYKLWNDGINKGLDNNSTFYLAMAGVLEQKIRCSEPYVIDVKSKTNIWPFNSNLGKPYPLKNVLHGLSKEETDLLTSIIDANKVHN